MKDITKLTTEQRNKNTYNIDKLSSIEMVTLMNQEDQAVLRAVADVKDDIAQAIDIIYDAITSGGRLIYMGAGTSGRLGVLDASEWYPTFGVGAESVLGIIAGGDHALRNPIEGAEDYEEDAIKDLKEIHLNQKDVVFAIASSGRTPYCVGALKYGHSLGCQTISLANVKDSVIGRYADVAIEAVSGPEVVTGSTRLKAGTTQKMVLNIISTSVMIQYGKVYGNLMVDVNPVNQKLILRAQSIIREATGVDEARSIELLKESKNNVKAAIVMEKLDLNREKAISALENHKGRIQDVIAK